MLISTFNSGSNLWNDCYNEAGWVKTNSNQTVSIFKEFQYSVRTSYCKAIRNGFFTEPMMMPMAPPMAQ